MPAASTPLATALVDNQKQFFVIAPGNDAAGKPAKFAGTPSVVSSDVTVVTLAALQADGVTPDTAGLNWWLVAGNPGTAEVTITVEGDATPGVDTLVQVINVAVSGGDPTGIGVTLSPPVTQ